MVAVELAAPGGAPDVSPFRGPVAGAGEAVALHEGLGEHRRVAVGGLPVGRQPAGDRAEDRRGQVRHAHVRQDEESLPTTRCSRDALVVSSQPRWPSRAAHRHAEAAKASAASTPAGESTR